MDKVGSHSGKWASLWRMLQDPHYLPGDPKDQRERCHEALGDPTAEGGRD